MFSFHFSMEQIYWHQSHQCEMFKRRKILRINDVAVSMTSWYFERKKKNSPQILNLLSFLLSLFFLFKYFLCASEQRKNKNKQTYDAFVIRWCQHIHRSLRFDIVRIQSVCWSNILSTILKRFATAFSLATVHCVNTLYWIIHKNTHTFRERERTPHAANKKKKYK